MTRPWGNQHRPLYPKVKVCEWCGCEYSPPARRRSVSKTCGKECRYLLTAQTQCDPSAPRSAHKVRLGPRLSDLGPEAFKRLRAALGGQGRARSLTDKQKRDLGRAAGLASAAAAARRRAEAEKKTGDVPV